MNPISLNPRAWMSVVDKRWLVRAAVLAIAAGAALVLVSRQVHTRRHTAACRMNMETIFRALVAADRDENRLPDIELYPDDVRQDEASLLSRLARYGITSTHCICPAAGPVLQETGITYVWNTELNGKKLADLAAPQWMLTDLSAMDPRLPGVHGGYGLVLYSDGRIERSRRPPPIP